MSNGITSLNLSRLSAINQLETQDIKHRIRSLETQEASGALLADGSTLGATDQSQQFEFGIISTLIDAALLDPTNGNYFNGNTNTFPAGWTQATAPQATVTNNPYGFWTINGSSGTGAWKFRLQSPFNIESLVANTYKSFHIGPLIIKESLPTADLNYYFGVYRNNAGVIDENTFVRININWLNASSLWQIRAERKDGTTQTNGTYYTLARVPLQPMWLRVVAANTTNKDVLGYFGPVRYPNAQMQLMSATLGAGISWGQAWIQFSMTRGAGPDDRVFIGGYDYSNDS